jgi:predicted MFS family arabinose efflux permease
VIVSFVVSFSLLAAFVLIESRSATPLVRLSIFRIRSLSTANLSMFFAFSGIFAMFFFNTLYIQRVLGYGPLKAGFAFLPFTAGIIVSAGLASTFAPRVGVRLVAGIGMVVSAAGMLLLVRLPVDGNYATDVLPSMILTSLGMGAVFMPLTLIATTGLEDTDQGLASGLFNTSQQIGGALGLALLSTLAASKTSSYHGTKDAALVYGFRWAFAGGAALIMVAFVIMLVRLRERDVAKIMAAASSNTAPVTV